MSDQSQGPGWWLASDGKWYPPDQAPAVPPPETWAAPPPGPPPSSGMSTGAKVALAIVGGLVGLIILSVLAVAVLGTEESGSSFSSTGTAIDGAGDGGDGGDDTAGDAEVPDGYEVIEGDGVSIAAPESWQELSPDDFEMSTQELEEAFPDAPEGFIDQATSAFDQGASLVAFDYGTDFSSNVNIASFPGEAPLGLLEGEASRQVETLGGRVVSADEVSVPAGEALRIEYTLDVAGPDGSSIAASGVQFYVLVDGRTHVVTITTGDDAGELADAMIDTFRVG